MKKRTWNGKTLELVIGTPECGTFRWVSDTRGASLRIDTFVGGAYARAEFAGGLMLNSGRCKSERTARRKIDEQLHALDRFVSEVLYGN